MDPRHKALIEQLRSDSIHARYGAVMELRKIGPEIVSWVTPLVVSLDETTFTRLAALEALRPFPSRIGTGALRAFSSTLPTTQSPAVKLEIIELLKVRSFGAALPDLRACLNDHSQDEHWNPWSGDGVVSSHARSAIAAFEMQDYRTGKLRAPFVNLTLEPAKNHFRRPQDPPMFPA